MIVKLLTEHNFEFLSLTGGCRGSSEAYTMSCQKATLLEISCTGSNSVKIVHHDYERLIEKSVLRICLH